MSEQPKYIVVEGPIGVGKTTLASRLAKDFQAELVLEEPASNPFLERFYSNPKQMALHTQLHFLMQRQSRIESLNFPLAGMIVTDFLLEKDRLFAESTLDENELSLYEKIHERVITDSPNPDLVVYLQAPVEVLLQRIRGRGQRFERAIDSTYLQLLNDAYARFFHYYTGSSLIIVNATEINFAQDGDDYQQLFEQIKSISKGRHFFNPLPA
jgi:deoxyadenosine/deoxycytidine kinase